MFTGLNSPLRRSLQIEVFEMSMLRPQLERAVSLVDSMIDLLILSPNQP
jgi:hypothetical protein